MANSAFQTQITRMNSVSVAQIQLNLIDISMYLGCNTSNPIMAKLNDQTSQQALVVRTCMFGPTAGILGHHNRHS